MLGDVGKRMVVSPDIWQLMREGSDGLPVDGGRGNDAHGGEARGESPADDDADPEAGGVKGASLEVLQEGTDDVPMDDGEGEDGDDGEQEEADEEDLMDGEAS